MLEMKKVLSTKLNKKGFTLAELLVVVAIIAILVAISIPIFTGKLDKARESTDLANLRAAKGAATTAILSEDYGVFTKDADGTKYTGYYDADNGKIVPTNAATIKKYGQSSEEINGSESGEPKDKIIKIVYTISGEQFEYSWVTPGK